MKIVNKRKFVRTIIMLVIIFIGLIYFSKAAYSKGEIDYEENYICSGDTLWSIAKEEKETNKYFENKDIREIIYELQEVNNLDNCNLYEGQKIQVPVYK